MTIRLMLVDDQELLRLGFRMVLDAQPDMTVVAEAGDGAEALRTLTRITVDVILMDIRMPNLDGVEATRRITRGGCGDGPRVLVLTTFDLDEYVFAALRAGASGFLLKDTRPADLLSGIRAVHRGDAVVAPSATRRLIDRYATHLPTGEEATPATLDVLTDRELEILRHLAKARSNAEIAQHLHLSEATVKTHVSRILGKLGLRDRVQAVVVAYELGLVKPAG